MYCRQKGHQPNIYKGGYTLLEKRLRKAKIEAIGLESLELVHPPARYEMWKAT